MRINILDVVAVNPYVIRIILRTEKDENTIRYYELAVAAELFTNRNDANEIEINLDAFQQAVSQKVMETNNMANLAAAISERNMEWELVAELSNTVEDTTDKNGLLLAYGDNNDNTES